MPSHITSAARNVYLNAVARVTLMENLQPPCITVINLQHITYLVAAAARQHSRSTAKNRLLSRKHRPPYTPPHPAQKTMIHEVHLQDIFFAFPIGSKAMHALFSHEEHDAGGHPAECCHHIFFSAVILKSDPHQIISSSLEDSGKVQILKDRVNYEQSAILFNTRSASTLYYCTFPN